MVPRRHLYFLTPVDPDADVSQPIPFEAWDDDAALEQANNLLPESGSFELIRNGRSIASLRAGAQHSLSGDHDQNVGSTSTAGNQEVLGEGDNDFLQVVLGGGALGAGLGVAALALPGVGPLPAAGAIAVAAVPQALGIGAAAGAAVGALKDSLKKRGSG